MEPTCVSQFRMAAWVGLPWRPVLPSAGLWSMQGDNDTHEAARSLFSMRMRGKYTAKNFMTDDFDIMSILLLHFCTWACPSMRNRP